MVTFESTFMNPEDHVCHIRCLKGDEKPTNVGANSDLIEIDPDTGDLNLYFFDKEKNEWILSE